MPLLSIEVKGGADASNAHNRAGEAEKSHIKEAVIGYGHRWTIIQIPHGQRSRIVDETPSSTEVFEFNEITQQSGEDWVRLKSNFFDIINRSNQNISLN